MGALIANLGRIQGNTDIHLLLTHHQPAEKERMRGHGALLGAVDTTIHVTKAATGRLAEVVKSSDHRGRPADRVFAQERHDRPGRTRRPDHGAGGGRGGGAPAIAPKKKAKLSAAAKVAINALQEAIDELGADPAGLKPHPADDQGGDHGAMAQLRLSARHQHVDEPRARRQAFERATIALVAAKFIGVWEPHVWIS